MWTFIGILLIELKVFGLALRTPVLFSYYLMRSNSKYSILGFSFLMDGILSDINGFSKVNVLTFIIICIGAWVMVPSYFKTYSRSVVIGIIKFSYILFSCTSVVGLCSLGRFFSDEGLVFIRGHQVCHLNPFFQTCYFISLFYIFVFVKRIK